jgi:phage terminase large subunit
MTADAKFPLKLQFLFEPHRYKVSYGGRGAAKSWGYARALLIQGSRQRLRVLCGRETQKSITDSVHKLLSDQVEELGLSQHYDVQKSSIIGRHTGTEFFFAGLKHNVDNIKSIEAVDVCWVEEAQTVTRGSWEKLIPTIRKEGSEIWVTFNPDLETDDTYQRFVVNPPPNAKVVKVTWRDNPWFPEVLRAEMQHLKRTDIDRFNHIWEGQTVNVLAGAIYANELRAVEAEDRITRVPYDRTRPVDCFWDLGYGDLTAIWFAQAFPFEYRVIDYLEGSGKTIHWYLQQMQARGYTYGTDWLPWDLGLHAAKMGSGKSIEQLMRDAGRNVEILPKLSISEGINAARLILPQCWFDRERCADGLQALRNYRYGEVKNLQHPTREPLHDWASHAADAFRYFAVAIKAPERKMREIREAREDPGDDAWMG